MRANPTVSLIYIWIFFVLSCDTSDERLSTRILEISILDSVEIHSTGFVEFIDYNELSEELLFYSYGQNELILYDTETHGQSEFSIGLGQPDVGSILSSCSFDPNGDLIFVTELGGYKYQKKQGRSFQRFKDKVSYPNSYDKKISQFQLSDSTYVEAYLNKGYFEVTGNYTMDKSTYYQNTRFMNVYRSTTDSISFAIGYEESGIFSDLKSDPKTIPGIRFHYLEQSGYLGFIVNPNPVIHYYDPKNNWRLIETIELKNLKHWTIPEFNGAFDYQTPKYVIIPSFFLRVANNDEIIALSYIEALDEDLYDQTMLELGDYNLVNDELHQRRSKFSNIYKSLNDPSIEYVGTINLSDHLNAIEYVFDNNQVLISTDPLVIEKEDKTIFYFYKISL